MSKYFFVPHFNNFSLPDTICSGEIHYPLNAIKYETLENIEDKVNKLCVLIVSKNKCAVGLEYDMKLHEAPVVLIKEEKYSLLVKLCKKFDVAIEYKKKLAEYIFINTEKNESVSPEIWPKIANLFSDISEKDAKFKEKINYIGKND